MSCRPRYSAAAMAAMNAELNDAFTKPAKKAKAAEQPCFLPAKPKFRPVEHPKAGPCVEFVTQSGHLIRFKCKSHASGASLIAALQKHCEWASAEESL